jgi:DNA-binding NarL/FixJ family response regulator
MVVVDRSTALIPLDPADDNAGAIHYQGVGPVAPLIALFEQIWANATPFAVGRSRDVQGLTAQERDLLGSLAGGHTDQAAAVRLGVSERTVRRMMADLMERLGARSRFEAGLSAGRAGWL